MRETSRKGFVAEMIDYWDDMAEYGIRPDERVCEVMLEGCVNARDPEIGFRVRLSCLFSTKKLVSVSLTVE